MSERMSETCPHCNALVDYECCEVTKCRACGKRLYAGIPLPEGVAEIRASVMEGIVVIDRSIRGMWRLIG